MLQHVQQRLSSRLRYKIILPFMVLAALMLVLLGLLAFYTIANRLQEQLNLELQSSAANTALELEKIEQDTLDQMRLVITAEADAANGVPSTAEAFASGNDDQIRQILTLAFNYYKPSRLIALDRAGNVLIDLADPQVHQQSPSLEHSATLATNPVVQAVLAGQTDALGDKYTSLLQMGADQRYTMLFVIAPIKQVVAGSDQEQVVGALLFAEPLNKIITDKLLPRNRSTLTAILDGNGQVLGSNAPENNADIVLNASQVAQVTPAGNEDRSLIAQVELSGKSFQVNYYPLRIRRSINGFFAVALPRDAISNTWAESRFLIAALATLVLGGVILTGTWITRRITTPLSELASTALEVKGGHLESRSAIQQSDEVGTLAGVLNEMTDRLLDLYRTSRSIGAELSIAGVLEQTTAAINRVVPGTTVAALLLHAGRWQRHTLTEAHDCDPPLAASELNNLPPVVPLDASSPVHIVVDPDDRDVWLALPLKTQQQSIGLLLVSLVGERPSAIAVSEPLSAIASMTASALQNAMLYATVEDEASRKQAILQSIADGVLVFGSDGRVILANGAASAMLGLRPALLLGRQFGELALKPVGGGPELFGQGDTSAPSLYEVGTKVIRLSAAPVVGLEGRQSGQVLVLHDVTVEREVDRAKTDFIATISHELRTPLTSVCGYTDLLLRGLAGPLVEEQTEFLTTIRQQSQSMVDVLQNVIIIASIEAGTMAPDPHPYTAKALIEQVVKPMRKPIEAKGLKLQLEIAPNLPEITTDIDHFKIIMSQLLENARRYTTEGSVVVRVLDNGDMLRVDVQDTGRGISAEEQTRLFKRFQRGGEQSGLTSKDRGAGLGLAIAKQLVEHLGGRIWAESQVGVGSTFSLVVPYVNDRELQSTEHAAATA